MSYAPELILVCDDWACCGSDGGTWRVRCRVCGQTWPCPEFIENHTLAQVRREKRYTNAREYPPWPEVENSPYEYQDRFDKWRRTPRA